LNTNHERIIPDKTSGERERVGAGQRKKTFQNTERVPSLQERKRERERETSFPREEE